MLLSVLFSQLVPSLSNMGVMKSKTVTSSCFQFSQNFYQEESVKNSQEFKNTSSPKILLRAVWCYWQCRGKKKSELLERQNAVASHT